MADPNTQALQERYDAAMASLGTLQAKLDAALQRHQDDAAAHVQAIAELTNRHQVDMAAALAAGAPAVTRTSSSAATTRNCRTWWCD